jgi:hypothetical protein
VDKVSAELLALTYGSLVVQLLRDCGGAADEVNTALERMGYSIGVRLVEEFLARSGAVTRPCRDLAETGEVLARVAFRMFLGVSAAVGVVPTADRREFSVVFDENPLAEFVELPPPDVGLGSGAGRLHYSNVLCGVVRGALEMLGMRVEARFVRDTLAGADTNEIRVVLKEMLVEEKPAETE